MTSYVSKQHTTMTKPSTAWNRQCRTYLLLVVISLSAIGAQLTHTAVDTWGDAGQPFNFATNYPTLEPFSLNTGFSPLDRLDCENPQYSPKAQLLM
ncbi:MAG: hypothetical protein ACI96P_001016 [Candidatus Azotimanducaceae bacterium]